jgi:hypothetical protein
MVSDRVPQHSQVRKVEVIGKREGSNSRHELKIMVIRADLLPVTTCEVTARKRADVVEERQGGSEFSRETIFRPSDGRTFLDAGQYLCCERTIYAF